MFRIEGGIPPLVELLEHHDVKVQRAAAGALRTLAFKNDENKNQVKLSFPICRIILVLYCGFEYILQICRLLNAMLYPPSY